MKLVYRIAGRSDDPGFAKAVRIAENLAVALKNFEYERQMVHPEDWDSYLRDINDRYGFKHKGSPIVWSYTDEYIGGAADFEALAIRKYDYNFALPRSFLEKIAVENHAECVDSLEAQREQQEKARLEDHRAQRDKELNEITSLIKNLHCEAQLAKQFGKVLQPLQLRVELLRRTVTEKPLGNAGITAWKKKFEEVIRFEPSLDFKVNLFVASASQGQASVSQDYVFYHFQRYLDQEYTSAEDFYAYLLEKYGELAQLWSRLQDTVQNTEKPWRTVHVLAIVDALLPLIESVYLVLSRTAAHQQKNQLTLEDLLKQRLADPLAPPGAELADFSRLHSAFVAGSLPGMTNKWLGAVAPLQWKG